MTKVFRWTTLHDSQFSMAITPQLVRGCTINRLQVGGSQRSGTIGNSGLYQDHRWGIKVYHKSR